MDNDEKFQKQMEFIVEHLAQLTTKQEQTENIVNRLANASLDRITNLEDKVSALVDAQIKTEEHISALASAQANTDERLNAFISVVERYISKERNGDSEG